MFLTRPSPATSDAALKPHRRCRRAGLLLQQEQRTPPAPRADRPTPCTRHAPWDHSRVQAGALCDTLMPCGTVSPLIATHRSANRARIPAASTMRAIGLSKRIIHHNLPHRDLANHLVRTPMGRTAERGRHGTAPPRHGTATALHRQCTAPPTHRANPGSNPISNPMGRKWRPEAAPCVRTQSSPPLT